MSNQRYTYTIAFNADTSQVQSQLNNLKISLQNITNFKNLDIGAKITPQIQQGVQAAQQLQVALNNAINVNTGKLNLTQFQNEIKKSGMSLEQYRNQLMGLGPSGVQAFNQMSQAVMAAEIPLKRTSALMDKMITTMGNTLRWSISSAALMVFTSTIRDGYQYAQDLNESLNNIRIVTGYSVDKMKEFTLEANRAAKALSTTTNEYAKASLIYFQQGLDDAAVNERTQATVKMAQVTGQAVSETSDQMTAIWNNFADGTKHLEYYADVITKLGANTASSSEEIATGLEKFAAVANTIGLSYEYATATLATVTATTRQSADVVGTAFKTLFSRMEQLKLGETLDDGTTLGQYSEALYKVGVNIKDANGELKNMDQILDETGAKWQDLSRDQQVALAQSVAGIRQYQQFIALMDNYDFFTKNVKDGKSATGELTKQHDIYAESWEAANNRVKASAETIYQEVFKDDFFIDLMDGASKLLDMIGLLIKNLGGIGPVLNALVLKFFQIKPEQVAGGFNRGIDIIREKTGLALADAQHFQKEMIRLMTTTPASSMSVESATSTAHMKQMAEIQDTIINHSSEIGQKEGEILNQRLQSLKALQDTSAEMAKQIDAQRELQSQMIGHSKGGRGMSAEEQAEVQGELDNLATERARQLNMSDDELLQTLDPESVHKSAKEIIGGNQRTKQAFTDYLDKMGVEYDPNAKIGDLRAQSFDVARGQVASQTRQRLSSETSKSITEIGNRLGLNETQIAELDESVFEESRTIAAKQKREADIQREGNRLKSDIEKGDYSGKESAPKIEDNSENINKTNDALEEMVGTTKDATAGTEGLTQEQEKNTVTNQNLNDTREKSLPGLKRYGAAIKEAQKEQISFGQSLTAAASVAMAAGMAISSISGTIQTLKDPDATGWQKFTSILMTLGITIPMVTQAFNAENMARASKLPAKIAEIFLTEEEIKLAKEQAVATTGATAKTKTETAALWSKVAAKIKDILISNWYIAVAALVVGAIVAIVAAHKSEEEVLAEKNKRLEEQNEALNETKKRYDTLKSSIDNLNSANQTINSLQEGTKEWTQAVQECNAEVLELIRQYPELANQVDNVNGRLVLQDNALEDLLDKQQKQIYTETANVYRAQADLNQTKAYYASKDADKELRSIILGAKNISILGSLAKDIADISNPLQGIAIGFGDDVREKQGKERIFAGGALVPFDDTFKAIKAASLSDEVIKALERHGNGILSSGEELAEALNLNYEKNKEQIDALVENSGAINELRSTIEQEIQLRELNEQQEYLQRGLANIEGLENQSGIVQSGVAEFIRLNTSLTQEEKNMAAVEAGGGNKKQRVRRYAQDKYGENVSVKRNSDGYFVITANGEEVETVHADVATDSLISDAEYEKQLEKLGATGQAALITAMNEFETLGGENLISLFTEGSEALNNLTLEEVEELQGIVDNLDLNSLELEALGFESLEEAKTYVNDLLNSYDIMAAKVQRTFDISGSLQHLNQAFSELSQNGRVSEGTINSLQEAFGKLGQTIDELDISKIVGLSGIDQYTALSKVVSQLANPRELIAEAEENYNNAKTEYDDWAKTFSSSSSSSQSLSPDLEDEIFEYYVYHQLKSTEEVERMLQQDPLEIVRAYKQDVANEQFYELSEEAKNYGTSKTDEELLEKGIVLRVDMKEAAQTLEDFQDLYLTNDWIIELQINASQALNDLDKAYSETLGKLTSVNDMTMEDLETMASKFPETLVKLYDPLTGKFKANADQILKEEQQIQEEAIADGKQNRIDETSDIITHYGNLITLAGNYEDAKIYLNSLSTEQIESNQGEIAKAYTTTAKAGLQAVVNAEIQKLKAENETLEGVAASQSDAAKYGDAAATSMYKSYREAYDAMLADGAAFGQLLPSALSGIEVTLDSEVRNRMQQNAGNLDISGYESTDVQAQIDANEEKIAFLEGISAALDGEGDTVTLTSEQATTLANTAKELGIQIPYSAWSSIENGTATLDYNVLGDLWTGEDSILSEEQQRELDSLVEQMRGNASAAAAVLVKQLLDFEIDDSKDKDDDDSKSEYERQQIERYQNIENKLKAVRREIDALEESEERLYGKDKIDALNQRIAKLKEEGHWYWQLAEAAEANIKKDNDATYSALKKIGLQDILRIDPTRGVMNIEEALNAIEDYRVTNNGNETAQEFADQAEQQLTTLQESYDKRNEAEDEYTNSVRERADTELQNLEYQIEILDKQKDILDQYNELNDKISETFVSAAVSLQKKLNNSFDTNDTNIDQAWEFLESYQNDYNKYFTANGVFKQEYDKTGKPIYDETAIREQLQDTLSSGTERVEELLDFVKDFSSYTKDVFDAIKEEMEEMEGALSHAKELISSAEEIMKLTGQLNGRDGLQRAVGLAQQSLAASRAQAKIDTAEVAKTKAVVDAWKTELDRTPIGSSAYVGIKENYDAAVKLFQEAQQAQLKSAKEAMQAAKKLYEAELELAAYEFEQIVTKSMGFEFQQMRYDNLLADDERYLDIVNQTIELNSLSRKIQESVDNQASKAAKAKLSAIAKEIDAMKERNDISKFELDIMQKRYDLTLKEIALEEARNAKTSMRLARDASGNWSYVYTANQDTINSAQEEVDRTNQDIYNTAKQEAISAQGEMIKLEKKTANALKDLDKRYRSGEISEEEYKNQSKAIRDQAVKQYSYLEKQFNLALTTAAQAGKKVVDDFGNNYLKELAEMTVGSDSFALGLDELINNMTSAGEAYQTTVGNIAEETSTTLGDLGTILNEADKTVQNINATYITFINTAYGSIDKVKEITDTYRSQITVIKQLSDAYLGALRNKKALEGLRDNVTYNGSSGVYHMTSGDNSGTNIGSIVYGENSGKYYVNQFGAGQQNPSFNTLAEAQTYKESIGMATGGYTGAWGPEGRFALLHQKELVLNAKDTENMLQAVKYIRQFEISKAIRDLDLMSAITANLLQSKFQMQYATAQREMQQHVSIEANFPGVESAAEIERAFNDLINQAAQFVSTY